MSCAWRVAHIISGTDSGGMLGPVAGVCTVPHLRNRWLVIGRPVPADDTTF